MKQKKLRQCRTDQINCIRIRRFLSGPKILLTHKINRTLFRKTDATVLSSRPSSNRSSCSKDTRHCLSLTSKNLGFESGIITFTIPFKSFMNGSRLKRWDIEPALPLSCMYDENITSPDNKAFLYPVWAPATLHTHTRWRPVSLHVLAPTPNASLWTIQTVVDSWFRQNLSFITSVRSFLHASLPRRSAVAAS